MLSSSVSSTSRSARSRIVHFARPPGGSEHASAASVASWWPSSFLALPGRGLSESADSKPSRTKRLRIRSIVTSCMRTRSAISRSSSPSSAASSTSARLSLRALHPPLRVSSSSPSRSSSVSPTIYFFTDPYLPRYGSAYQQAASQRNYAGSVLASRRM